ncbi:15868_t:CDS:2, partial [Cetraspora pellucida]
LRVAFPVRKGTAVIDILNKAKKKVLHAHLKVKGVSKRLRPTLR